MGSVLAIVSKAVFEKALGFSPAVTKRGASLAGHVLVGLDSYVTSHKAFDTLARGGSIFMVTVRPPDEKVWLVAILDDPARNGTTWKAEPNVTVMTDITKVIRKLRFESGTGITAAKGKLAMSLQTPRALTEADVTRLRSVFTATKTTSTAKTKTPRNPAAAAYEKAVEDIVLAKRRTSRAANKTSATPSALKLVNGYRPFDGKLSDLTPATKKQLQAVLGDTPLKAFFDPDHEFDEDDEDAAGEELKDMTIADIVDASGKVTCQLMTWPYGDGAVVRAGTTKMVASICQHGMSLAKGIDKTWLAELAKAWDAGATKVGMSPGHIDFSDEDRGG